MCKSLVADTILWWNHMVSHFYGTSHYSLKKNIMHSLAKMLHMMELLFSLLWIALRTGMVLILSGKYLCHSLRENVRHAQNVLLWPQKG